MFRITRLIFIITILLSACTDGDKIAPTTIWSAGCGTLAPKNGAYQFSGTCCEYTDLPNLSFRQGKTVTVDGTYHSFTGAGFTNEPVKITMIVSPDGNKLKLSFIAYGTLHEYDMVPGGAKMVCDCLCE
ncbi:hypothetical protein [Dyadobacter luticola]|uniref:Lipoprotein n=1 Tax=Dyadobacter luticola TaxID=1979387 RepID=A0A5R9L1M8_9BACT|nr:hypothetical protein [Dyadobacter luticola]TLV02287.1 hypothetical protein FEN17_01195 [Dyadobacter luticola]